MTSPRPSVRYRRARRLVRQNDFTAAYKQGSRARCAFYTVVVRENGGSITRLGLSVGKAAYRDAVDRNRARRVLREAFRLAQHELPSGFDVVLIGLAGAGRLELAAVREPLVGLVHKAVRRLRERRATEANTATTANTANDTRGRDGPGGAARRRDSSS